MLDLNGLGIQWNDLHQGNIMKKSSGDYAIIDIGFSKSKGGQINLRELLLHEKRGYKFDLQQKFDEFNRDIFNDEITIAVSLSWNSQMRQKLGVTRYQFDATGFWNVRIVMSSFFDMTDVTFRETLIHEMVHCLMLQNGLPVDHGKEFVDKINEINSKFGTHITVTNDEPLTTEPRLQKKTENIIIKKNKSGKKSIALLGKKILAFIMSIDWQKYASDRNYPPEAIESIKLCITTADQTWRLAHSLATKIRFQQFPDDPKIIDEIENNSQLVQQLYP